MKGKLYITNSVNDVVSDIFDLDFDHQHLVATFSSMPKGLKIGDRVFYSDDEIISNKEYTISRIHGNSLHLK